MAKKTRKATAYNSSLGRKIARAARRSRSDRFHVISSISNRGKWNLVSEGSIRSIKVFTTANAAVSFARRSDKGGNTIHIIVHRTDGGIQNKITVQR